MIRAISAAIIKNKKILLVRKKETWILPGGKPENNESPLETLTREVREELSETKIKNQKYYNTFYGITPHSKKNLEVTVYLAELDGPLNMVTEKDSILEYQWVKKNTSHNLSETTAKILHTLENNNYL